MNSNKTSYEHFIRWVLERLGDSPRIKDSGAIARLKRADSREQAPQAWDIVLKLNIPPKHFSSCLLVAAAMCRRAYEADGQASLGRALASCYEDRDKEQGSLRLRRLLACSDGEELRAVLRPILSFINSRAKSRLNYAQLLDELVNFDWPEKQRSIKLRWAQDFWGLKQEEAST